MSADDRHIDAEVTLSMRLPAPSKDRDLRFLRMLISDAIGLAEDGILISVNQPKAIEIGDRIMMEDLTTETLRLLEEPFGHPDGEGWSSCKRAAAFYVQAILDARPGLTGLLASDDADLIVTTDYTDDRPRLKIGFTIEINWQPEMHPGRSSTMSSWLEQHS